MLLRFRRLMRLMASLPTMTLVQNGFMASDRLALTKPPGGLYAQHRTSASASIQSKFAARLSAVDTWLHIADAVALTSKRFVERGESGRSRADAKQKYCVVTQDNIKRMSEGAYASTTSDVMPIMIP